MKERKKTVLNKNKIVIIFTMFASTCYSAQIAL